MAQDIFSTLKDSCTNLEELCDKLENIIGSADAEETLSEIFNTNISEYLLYLCSLFRQRS